MATKLKALSMMTADDFLFDQNLFHVASSCGVAA